MRRSNSSSPIASVVVAALFAPLLAFQALKDDSPAVQEQRQKDLQSEWANLAYNVQQGNNAVVRMGNVPNPDECKTLIVANAEVSASADFIRARDKDPHVAEIMTDLSRNRLSPRLHTADLCKALNFNG